MQVYITSNAELEDALDACQIASPGEWVLNYDPVANTSDIIARDVTTLIPTFRVTEVKRTKEIIVAETMSRHDAELCVMAKNVMPQLIDEIIEVRRLLLELTNGLTWLEGVMIKPDEKIQLLLKSLRGYINKIKEDGE